MKMPKFSIRQATFFDLDDIYAIDQEAFGPYGTAEDREVFASRLVTYPAGFFVLTAGRETVGYACAEKWKVEREPQIGEDSSATHDPAGRVFCITGMAVRTAQRGGGGGLMLLDQLLALAEAEGCEKVVLETSHAAGLYSQRGFLVTGERRHGEARLDVMELKL